MPKGAVPERRRDVLASKAVGRRATIGADGRPQVNPVRFISDGERVHLSVKADTVTHRNLRAHPFVAMSVADPRQPPPDVEVRGEVVEFELFDPLERTNHLARKYAGGDFPGAAAGERRNTATIRVDPWTGRG